MEAAALFFMIYVLLGVHTELAKIAEQLKILARKDRK